MMFIIHTLIVLLQIVRFCFILQMGVPRATLQLVVVFTTATYSNILSPMLFMRDDAFKRLNGMSILHCVNVVTPTFILSMCLTHYVYYLFRSY